MSSKYKVVLLALMLGFAQTVFSQNSYSFMDKYGNQIKVSDWQTRPHEIHTTFLKQNLTGLDINKDLLNSQVRYNFIITIVSVKSNKKYRLTVVSYPIDAKIETIINTTQGHQVYFMKTKIVDGRLQIDQIKFDHSEI